MSVFHFQILFTTVASVILDKIHLLFYQGKYLFNHAEYMMYINIAFEV